MKLKNEDSNWISFLIIESAFISNNVCNLLTEVNIEEILFVINAQISQLETNYIQKIRRLSQATCDVSDLNFTINAINLLRSLQSIKLRCGNLNLICLFVDKLNCYKMVGYIFLDRYYLKSADINTKTIKCQQYNLSQLIQLRFLNNISTFSNKTVCLQLIK